MHDLPPTAPRRVLIVAPAMSVYGGAELVIVRLANHLTRQGVGNTLLTTAIPPVMRAELDGTEIRVVERQTPSLTRRITRALGLDDVAALRRELGRISAAYDVVNIHNFPAELAATACRRPVVWLCNEPPRISLRVDMEKRMIPRLVMEAFLRHERRVVRRRVDLAVVADPFNARRFESLYGCVPEIVPYGIDGRYFVKGDGAAARARFGLDERFTLLQVGMITPLKNQMESIRTLRQVKAEIPDARLVLAGAGEPAYLDEVRRFIRDNDLAGDVVITGHVDRAAVRDLYHAADLLIHPIRTQGGWLSPFEAVSAGLPVVVSEEMTAADLVRDHGLGIVTGDYSAAVLEIRRNASAYREAARAGRDWVAENLSWDRCCTQMTGLFGRVAGCDAPFHARRTS